MFFYTLKIVLGCLNLAEFVPLQKNNMTSVFFFIYDLVFKDWSVPWYDWLLYMFTGDDNAPLVVVKLVQLRGLLCQLLIKYHLCSERRTSALAWCVGQQGTIDVRNKQGYVFNWKIFISVSKYFTLNLVSIDKFLQCDRLFNPHQLLKRNPHSTLYFLTFNRKKSKWLWNISFHTFILVRDQVEFLTTSIVLALGKASLNILTTLICSGDWCSYFRAPWYSHFIFDKNYRVFFVWCTKFSFLEFVFCSIYNEPDLMPKPYATLPRLRLYEEKYVYVLCFCSRVEF